jgi:hypothetical protein
LYLKGLSNFTAFLFVRLVVRILFYIPGLFVSIVIARNLIIEHHAFLLPQGYDSMDGGVRATQETKAEGCGEEA